MTVVRRPEWSGGHLLHFDGVDWGGVTWRLECTHVSGDQTWCTFGAFGDIESDDCWLMSWWVDLGPELFEHNPSSPVTAGGSPARPPWPVDPSFPIPVCPWDWDPENGGTIGPDTPPDVS